MGYYARKTKEGRLQGLEEHLNGVTEIAEDFSRYKNLAKLSAFLHDIGKATQAFQEYLVRNGQEGK